jgi:thymidylate synthase (FAD)
MNEMINVLDKGYVRLTNVMGSDLSVVNSARVSYDKESTELSENDARLIRFLAREGHTSPFRHATLQFEMYAPLMLARQHWKYIVGSDHTMDAWNESSRRYVTEEPTFYIPQTDEWRSAPENSKQGSGGPLQDVLEYHEMGELQHVYERHIEESVRLYEKSIELGMAPEQARLFLPAYGMYVRYYWTASLQSVAHFLQQRLAHDSQVEIQEYAKAVKALVEPHFPVSIAELTK